MHKYPDIDALLKTAWDYNRRWIIACVIMGLLCAVVIPYVIWAAWQEINRTEDVYIADPVIAIADGDDGEAVDVEADDAEAVDVEAVDIETVNVVNVSVFSVTVTHKRGRCRLRYVSFLSAVMLVPRGPYYIRNDRRAQ
jgi:hypothetical protein